jgi:hypothetical protein
MPVVAVNNENQHEQTGEYRSRPRWSAGKKMEAVLRLLRGESLEELSRELKVEAHRLAALFTCSRVSAYRTSSWPNGTHAPMNQSREAHRSAWPLHSPERPVPSSRARSAAVIVDLFP